MHDVGAVVFASVLGGEFVKGKGRLIVKVERVVLRQQIRNDYGGADLRLKLPRASQDLKPGLQLPKTVPAALLHPSERPLTFSSNFFYD